MSQVSINSNLVYAEYDKYDASMTAAILRVKESFPDKGKWTVLVPMIHQGENRWQGKALNKRGATVIVNYDPLTGVTVTEKEE
jgi:CRISPR-associated endonuclease/helicase Cas3